MHRSRSRRIQSWALGVITRGLSIALFTAAGLLPAQASKAPGGKAGVPQPPVAQTPTLQSMFAASIGQDVTATRLRRFRADDGSVVAVRELFEVKGGAQVATKEVAFLGVEGEPSGSALSLKWAQTYQRFGLLLSNSGIFAVRDAVRAQLNYVVHDFGPVVRASRAAHRFVVFPGVFDRAFWVIDVDQQTSALLYSAEFDSQLRMLSEVEVVAFQPTVRALLPQVQTAYADYATARSQMTVQGGLIDPDVSLAVAYELDSIEVRHNVLSGQQMMVTSYSDGVDQFFVVQMPGTSDWLAGIPGTVKGGQAMGRRYRDPTMSVHMFWEDGVTFHVAGGGALASLDSLAKQIYLQAIVTP